MDLSRLKLQEFSEDLATACKNAADKNVLSLCERSFFEALPRLLEPVLEQKTAGDVLMSGVWRGGLAAYVTDLFAKYPEKNIFLVDTFRGFTKKPSPQHPKDHAAYEFFERCGIDFHEPGINEVKENFTKLGISTKQVQFISTDITANNESFPLVKLCFLHVDLDFYEATYAALEKFYPMLSHGALVVVDDYGNSYFNCREAVNDFRKAHEIENRLFASENSYAYWYK